jgi:hypothetical protein
MRPSSSKTVKMRKGEKVEERTGTKRIHRIELNPKVTEGR